MHIQEGIGKKMNKDKLPFYERKISFVIMKIAYILGAVLIIMSPFLKWKKLVIKTDKYSKGSYSFFNCVKRGISSLKNGFDFYKIVPCFLFLLLILTGLYMLYVALKDVDIIKRPEESSFFVDRFTKKYKFISRLMVLPLVILELILCIKTKMYSIQLGEYKEMYNTWKSIVALSEQQTGYKSSMKVKLYTPFSFYLIIFGLILFIGGFAFKYILDTLNED